MVSIKSILKFHGVYEWLLVRISAIVILLYVIYFSNFIIFNNFISYEIWHDFFNRKITKIFNIIALISILIHAWIGINHILEDYIKISFLQRIGTWCVKIIIFMYLLFGIAIIWSI